MILTRPSASGLARALACPRGTCGVELTPDTEPGEAADRGTRQHAALERKVLGARDADVFAMVTPDEEEALRLAIAHLSPMEPLLPEWPMVEVECWTDPLAREARFGVKAQCPHRNPLPPPHGWYRGTADRLGKDPDGTPAVEDYKSGNPANQSSPEKVAQLYFFAVFLATHPRSAPLVAERGVRVRLYLTQNAGKDRRLSHPEVVLTPAQIEKFVGEWQDLELLYRRIEAGEPPPACTEKGDRFCRVVGCKQARPTLTRRAAKRVGLA